MSISLFHELVPFLRSTDLVYLQGWGEPLLNNDLFEMIRVCKARGKRVGFTTNGMLLTENTIRALVDLQLDIIGISLAGVTPKTHNQLRKGTNLTRVISSLEQLGKTKAQKKTQRPAVHLAYLMLKSNFHELEDILPLAESVGATQIIASNLTLIVDPKLSAEAIFNDTEHGDDYRMALEKMKDKAARENIVFEYHGPGLDDLSLGCRENVQYACVINVDGDVGPCVVTNPVLCRNRECRDEEPTFHVFKDQLVPIRGISFGNIGDENLASIWRNEPYIRFRNTFSPETSREPDGTQGALSQCCLQCYKRLGA